jgi:cysteine synthase A
MSTLPNFPTILNTVGHTPLVRLQRVIPTDGATVLVECEYFNPLSSVKDRIGKAMIEAGEADGSLHPNVAVAARLAARPENQGKTIVTFAASSGERYLSTPLFGLVGMHSIEHSTVQI